MRITWAFVALMFASTSYAYQTQVDFNYFDEDDFGDTINLQGTYHFGDVSTDGVAWDDAAFMGRNSNVSLGYFDFDGDADSILLGGEYMGRDNNLYGSLVVARNDSDLFDSTTNYEVNAGYFVGQQWLVYASTIILDSAFDGVDDPWSIGTKYIASLNNDQFLNVEVEYYDDGEDNDADLLVDYYFQPQTSVGAAVTTADGTDFVVAADHYFTPSFGGRVAYLSGDFDVWSIGVTGRF